MVMQSPASQPFDYEYRIYDTPNGIKEKDNNGALWQVVDVLFGSFAEKSYFCTEKII